MALREMKRRLEKDVKYMRKGEQTTEQMVKDVIKQLLREGEV